MAICVAGWSALAVADGAKAKQLNNEGMRRYGKQDYRGALAAFDKALVEDPAFVLAHYNAASMASLLGDNARTLKELEWLVASKDAAAAKALAQARTDRDLDRASMHPRVRALVGLPTFDKIDLPELLTERGGIWGTDSSFCAGPAFTLLFKKGGAVAIKSEFACDATDAKDAETGTWAVVQGKLVITSKRAFTGGKAGAIATCDGGGADGSACLVIAGDQAGSFHRGPGSLE